MRIRKKEPSVGVLGKIINSFSSSEQDTYSCDFINQLFPIGKVEIFFDNADHSNHLGLKWERTSIGRVPVGVDSSDTDFNTIGKTGGEKTHVLTIQEMPNHNHGLNSSMLTLDTTQTAIPTSRGVTQETWYFNAVSQGNNQPHNILQPYEVMAFWKRVE